MLLPRYLVWIATHIITIAQAAVTELVSSNADSPATSVPLSPHHEFNLPIVTPSQLHMDVTQSHERLHKRGGAAFLSDTLSSISRLLTPSSTTSTSSSCTVNSTSTPRQITNIMTIVLTVADQVDVLSDFYLGSVLPSRGVLFTNVSAVSVASRQGNYIGMLAGSTLGVTGDGNVDLKGVSYPVRNAFYNTVTLTFVFFFSLVSPIWLTSLNPNPSLGKLTLKDSLATAPSPPQQQPHPEDSTNGHGTHSFPLPETTRIQHDATK
jgi:hypothetical protein